MSRLPSRAFRLSAVGVVPAGLAGAALGLGLALVALARRGKPLHPVGVVAPAVLSVSRGSVSAGSSLLDEAGEHHCLVRASYAVGTGPEHADIEGFALRVHASGAGAAVCDILFASTGTGSVGRHCLALRRAGAHDVQTTLFPLRVGDRGLLLRLDPLDAASQPWPTRYRLSWAHGSGSWHQFAELSVAWDGRGDAPERFDPVAHPLPGTAQYPVVAWLREPAYRLARLARPSAGRLPEAVNPGGPSV